MFRINIILMLVIALTSNAHVVSAQTNTPKQEGKIKAQVIKHGTARRVFVQLHSKEFLEGRITEIQADSFIIQALTNGNFSERKLNYSEVKNIMQPGVRSQSFSGRTAFILGIVTGVLMIVGQAVGNE